MYIKSFGGQKGGLSEPPRTPPAYGPDMVCQKVTSNVFFCLLVGCRTIMTTIIKQLALQS